MAQITGVEAAGWHELLENWWQLVLIGFILLSIGLGSTYVLYLVLLELHKWNTKRRSNIKTVSSSDKKHLEGAYASLRQHEIERPCKKPNSYGVYLGKFESPPTEAQRRLLGAWDLLIVDPSQQGVMETLSSGLYRTPSQCLARLDMDVVAMQSSQKPIVLVTEWLTGVLKYDAKSSKRQCGLTGILISNWDEYISTPLLREFSVLLYSINFSVYLETAAPKFLIDPKLAELKEITGLLIRNGTISQNGEERDAFQMAEMRPTIKAFVSQACLRPFVVLLWEVIDEDVTPLNAVIKRCYQWSRFYSALPWIGRVSALTSAELSLHQQEPLGAFDWLKEMSVMKIHEIWRSNQHISPQYLLENSAVMDELQYLLSFGPYERIERYETHSNNSLTTQGLTGFSSSRLISLSESPNLSEISSNTVGTMSIDRLSIPNRSPGFQISSDNFSLGWVSLLGDKAAHPISNSQTGSSYDYLGCFPLGSNVSRRSFGKVVRSQQQLRNMKLLDEIKYLRLNRIGQDLKRFCDALAFQDVRCGSDWLAAIQELAHQLSVIGPERLNPISVYVGLDSGFQINSEARFWAVYSVDEDSALHIYLSRNVQDLSGVILHTFLSSRGCPRLECFQAEVALSEWSESLSPKFSLPPRLIHDISLLSPAELLRFFRTLNLNPPIGDRSLNDLISAACEAQLIDAVDFIQLKELSTTGYLSERVSSRDLIYSRIKWYQLQGCQHIEESVASDIFSMINISITKMLGDRRISELQAITQVLESTIKNGRIDSRIDLVAFAIFCAMRKHAFDEAYIEVTDRNTLFNDQSDQAAAFAELFATGARCEAYFDVTPSAFGKLLSDRYRAYHHKTGHEPPIWSDKEPATPSAYAAAKIDVDPDAKNSAMSAYRRFTFLSVFAIPALLDILLLTTTGRGLYLSGYMSHSEQHSATLALMISLLISGAVGTWITCGGSYYLISMAFSAMNMFLVTRLVGGFAFTMVVAIVGLAVVGATNGITAGVVFFLYLIALTSYLCLLASLANFQYPGSAFQSGRPLIIMVIPFLFISPIITIWIPGYDIFIYLSVIYTFLMLLVAGVRYTGSRWTTWYLEIEKISDSGLREWYVETHAEGNEEVLSGLTDPGVLRLARIELLRKVKEARGLFGISSKDPVVLSLAKSYDATVFLLEWYSGYSGTPLPIPYSSTWNMQTKVALQTLKQLQTGIRLHNAFIHWRQAGDEVGCSLLYFLVALLDKWNAILAGGQLLGLSALNTRYRMPVGFALAYYLIGAVLLDFNAAKLHTMTARGQNMLIGDAKSIPDAVRREVLARRHLYWTMLGRYLLFHVWSLAVASSLLWVFDSTEESTVLFIAYIVAYTGLLWYQYTKIFSGPRSLKPLLVAVSIGLPLGQILRHYVPQFTFCDVTALGISTWTAAIMSLYYARIKTKAVDKPANSQELNDAYNKLSPGRVYHSFTNPGQDPLLSQDELRIIYDNVQALREEEKYPMEPQKQLGLQVKLLLQNALRNSKHPEGPLSRFALEAFPGAVEILERSISAFENGAVLIDCISMAKMTNGFAELKAVSCASDGQIRIVIGCETMDAMEQQLSISVFCQTASEILLHAVAECFMGLNHDDSTLAESLLSCSSTTHASKILAVSLSFENYLIRSKSSPMSRRSLASFLEKKTLQYLALGLDVDLDWERLPKDIRELVIKRSSGQEDEISMAQLEWLALNQGCGLPIRTYIARCNFGAFIAMSCRTYALKIKGDPLSNQLNENTPESLRNSNSRRSISPFIGNRTLRTLKTPFSALYHKVGIFMKLLAIAFVAEPEFQRELDYALHAAPRLIRGTVMFFATSTWMYTKILQTSLMPFFLLHGRQPLNSFWNHIGGSTISLKRQRVVIENTDGLSTAFIHAPYGRAGTFKVYQYKGDLEKEPLETDKLQRISTYNKAMLLLRREDYTNGAKLNVYKYEYANVDERAGGKRLSKRRNHLRYPILRKCIEGKRQYEEVNFDHRGLVQSGSYILHGSLIRFNCHYRQSSNFEDELLRAEYALPHLTCNVAWCAPPQNHQEKLDKWIPHSSVLEATFVLGSDVWESRWVYDHKFHPTIYTTLNGEAVETPPIIQWDHLGVLKKPTNFSFHDDDPLISFKSLRSHAVLRWLGLNTHHNPVSTSHARSRLWKAWKETPGFDGVIVRWLDEKLLRKEPLLRKYWRRRDRGDLASAEAFLNENADSIMAAIDLDNSISGWAPLAFKITDLYSFGQGGDANSRTRSAAPDFNDDTLQVLAVDSGTWPNEGGGVSACRRDMINNLRSVNWYMIAESANDFGLPKHQTEMNVRSLKVIPLWGLDFLTPTHGLFKDRLDSAVEHVPRDATRLDVKSNFLPILTALVKGARTSHFSKADILQTTRALVNLNTFFSDSKHWGAIWTSHTVKDAWRNLWISDLVSPTPSETWFKTEIPTIAQLDGALELWFRYLFIFSIPVPERIPAIFQASHHSVSASYGIVCKIKRGCTLQIWDHAISWRETNLYLSSDLCSMAPFVRNSLLGLMRITSQLILHHADTILPCADFFNPGWEVEIGTGQGTLEHRNIFKRKIDPVVNGIPDMSKFAPIKTITSKLPTVTMLSHVWYAKDIKTAILAADIIVNEWGFRDYRLDIYGAIDKAPTYSTDCFEIIASKSLPKYVTMCGEANPTAVLEKTWVFLNSSISEGLPLALGEAALTGAPVVCTDVGASLRVLTDPDTGVCYSTIVAPNDARNLARAQIAFLALLDQWAQYADDPEGSTAPVLTDKPTTDEVALITKRMYEKVEQRKALGMRSREIVQKSFGGERYLREHEQMLWIGKARYDLLHPSPNSSRTAARLSIEELPVASNVWGRTSVSGPERRFPPSSIQTSSMMTSSLEASTLMTSGIRRLFDSGVSGMYGGRESKASTLFVQSTALSTPVKKAMPARVTILRKGGYNSSGRSSLMVSKPLPGQDTFVHDITRALEQV